MPEFSEDDGLTFAVPYYSGPRYLTRALESIRALTGLRWRAIVCDDSPEGGAEELVRQIRDERIRYHRNARTLGIGGNFNRCIDLAETELVTVVHGDDELVPNYGTLMLDLARQYPDAVGYYCRVTTIGPDGNHVISIPDVVKDVINPASRREAILEGERGIRALLHGNFIIAPTLCFRKSVLGPRRFQEHLKFVVDLDFTMSLLLDGERLVGVPERSYRYRRHEDSATSELTRTTERFLEESSFYDRTLTVVRERGWDRCERICRAKRMIKLNMAFSAARSTGALRFRQAYRQLALIRKV
jgi:glycosyltransferase involved in cell wall biosynthesis